MRRRRVVLEEYFQASAVAVGECRLQLVQRRTGRPVVVTVQQVTRQMAELQCLSRFSLSNRR